MLRLLEHKPIAGVRNLNPTYCSILVSFDALKMNHGDVEEILRGYLDRLDAVPYLPEARDVQIPTCYDGEFGPDLNEVAALHGFTAAQTIDLHASVTYAVYFLGFVPGFAYLGELPEALATSAAGRPAPEHAPRQCGHRRQANRCLPIRDAQRLATDRTHPYRDVPS